MWERIGQGWNKALPKSSDIGDNDNNGYIGPGSSTGHQENGGQTRPRLPANYHPGAALKDLDLYDPSELKAIRGHPRLPMRDCFLTHQRQWPVKRSLRLKRRKLCRDYVKSWIGSGLLAITLCCTTYDTLLAVTIESKSITPGISTSKLKRRRTSKRRCGEANCTSCDCSDMTWHEFLTSINSAKGSFNEPKGACQAGTSRTSIQRKRDLCVGGGPGRGHKEHTAGTNLVKLFCR